jgi:hypothetical protein
MRASGGDMAGRYPPGPARLARRDWTISAPAAPLPLRTESDSRVGGHWDLTAGGQRLCLETATLITECDGAWSYGCS